MEKKYIGILGSTGSIGTQTLDIVRQTKKFKVTVLAAHSNINLLEKQIREFNPEIVCVYNEENAYKLKGRIKDLNIKITSKMEGLIEVSTYNKLDILVTALVGMIGIRPTIQAIKARKDIALANKETLVTAGHLIMPLVKEKEVKLLPVDSEHSAIFQCLNGEDKKEIKKIILTASGGPFRGKKLEELRNIKPKQALKHPNWSMGNKITIDSATMINKGLEVIEARWLFDIDISNIEVIVHPQSIIHSMVEYNDGSVISQMGMPDMRIPIQYALLYPERKALVDNPLDLADIGNLTFEKPDLNIFYGLKLGYKAGKLGDSMPTVYNSANELLVSKFLNKEIDFLMIPELIKAAMDNHKIIKNPNLDMILKTEEETYNFLKNKLEKQ